MASTSSRGFSKKKGNAGTLSSLDDTLDQVLAEVEGHVDGGGGGGDDDAFDAADTSNPLDGDLDSGTSAAATPDLTTLSAAHRDTGGNSGPPNVVAGTDWINSVASSLVDVPENPGDEPRDMADSDGDEPVVRSPPRRGGGGGAGKHKDDRRSKSSRKRSALQSSSDAESDGGDGADAHESVSRSLTAARRTKRSRTDRRPSVDASPNASAVLVAGGDQDSAHQTSQLLNLIETARATSGSTDAGDAATPATSSAYADGTDSGSRSSGGAVDMSKAIDFSLVITQPVVFRDMLSSVAPILNTLLPMIIVNGPDFNGVRICGLNDSKVCYMRSQFSCDSAYVSPDAVAHHGGTDTPVYGPAGSVRGNERRVRFHVPTKIMAANVKNVPARMRLRVVKSSTHNEVVCGSYEGTSTQAHVVGGIPTMTPEMPTNMSAQEEAEANDPAHWDPELTLEHDASFTLDVELLRSALNMASLLKSENVSFIIKEPSEQTLGRRPDPVFKHMVMCVRVGDTNGSWTTNFFAIGRWDEVISGPEDGGVGAAPGTVPPSSPGAAAGGGGGGNGSVHPTPRSYTVSGVDQDCSMPTEMQNSLKVIFTNVYQVKEMSTFLSGVRGRISVGLARDGPIAIEHGNAQYRVLMLQAPRDLDQQTTAPPPAQSA